MDTPTFEAGNLSDLNTDGTEWVVGFCRQEGAESMSTLRSVPEDGLSEGPWIKWARHAKGDPRGGDKPISVGRSLAMLVCPSGRFRLELSRNAEFPAMETHSFELVHTGDYLLWSGGWYHRWSVLEDCTIMTVRWIPLVCECEVIESTVHPRRS